METWKLFTATNPKVNKGTARGFLTAVLMLAPSSLSVFFNACAKATAGCIASCLNTAGMGGIFKRGETSNNIQRCRARRSEMLATDPRAFLHALVRDIDATVANAAEFGLRPVVRLNGTSDLDWSNLGLDLGKAWKRAGLTPEEVSALSANFAALVRAYSALGVVFYDYTKRLELFRRYRDARFPVDLTFSRAETAANKRDARIAMREFNARVAIVTDTRKNESVPESIDGVPCVDGDATDLRFLEPGGVYVVLRAKGRAKKDRTGFVLRFRPFPVPKASRERRAA